MSQGEANTAVERIASGFTSTTDIEQTSLNGRYVPGRDITPLIANETLTPANAPFTSVVAAFHIDDALGTRDTMVESSATSTPWVSCRKPSISPGLPSR
jgi:hypothetical protein